MYIWNTSTDPPRYPRLAPVSLPPCQADMDVVKAIIDFAEVTQDDVSLTYEVLFYIVDVFVVVVGVGVGGCRCCSCIGNCVVVVVLNLLRHTRS